MLFVATVVLVVVGLWFGWSNSYDEELAQSQAKGSQAARRIQTKLTKAVNRDVPRNSEQVQQHVTQLEKQLPARRRWMHCCRHQPSWASGAACAVRLCSVRAAFTVRDYYAERAHHHQGRRSVPRYRGVRCRYRRAFRIVTLNNLSISPRQDGALILDSTPRRSGISILTKLPHSARPPVPGLRNEPIVGTFCGVGVVVLLCWLRVLVRRQYSPVDDRRA